MEDRRKTPRIKEENEVTITVVPGENNFPKEKIIDNFTKDISAGGARIQTNILLPVDSLIELEFTSRGLQQQINSLGKVKWVRVLIEDESYEAGVEFSGDPGEAIRKLEDYISWKLKSNKAELIKKKLSPVDADDINSAAIKEQPPLPSADMNHAGAKEQSAIDSGDIMNAITKQRVPVDADNIHNMETKNRPPLKSKQWIKVAIILLFTINVIIVLFKIFGSVDVLDSATMPAPPMAAPAPKVTPAPASEATSPEAGEVTSAPAPEVTLAPSPEAAKAPAPEAAQKIKVIGNSDSKRYHLPGMKYYNAVKAYHRIEFDSEADAIKAGYQKAPQ